MAFPPNYRLDKSNRARTKAQKALEKQAKREEKAAQRKRDREGSEDETRRPDEGEHGSGKVEQT